MPFTDNEKRWLQIAMRNLMTASRLNSVAIRQVALAQMHTTNGNKDASATQIEEMRESLTKSDEALISALDALNHGLGIEE